MKIFRITAFMVAIAIFAIAAPARGSHPELLANIKSIGNNDQANEWLTYYYKHPRPDLAESAFYFFTAESEDNRERGLVPLAGVFAEVFRTNPKIASDLVAKIETPNQRMLLTHSIWMAQLENTADLLDALAKNASSEFKKIAKDLEYRDPPDLLNGQIESLAWLDFFWGAYFASGDSRYIERMIAVAPWSNLQDWPDRQQIGAAAKWSLGANAGQFPEVLAALESAYMNAAPENKPALNEILNMAKKVK